MIDGHVLTTEDRRDFGYMPEERGLYPKMAVREQLIYFAQLHGFDAAEAGRSADRLIEILGLTERAKDPVESLSLGNQQRAQIAVSLVHNPTALVLDEPFSGLDPIAVDVILGVLSDYAAQGVPVLLSSHQLDVVERLCDDIVIIGKGQIRATGAIDDLRRTHGSLRYRMHASTDLGWLRDQEGISVLELAGETALFNACDEETTQNVLRQSLAAGAVHEFSPVAPRLAEIFRETVTTSAQEDHA